MFKAILSAGLLVFHLCPMGLSAVNRKELPLKIQVEEVLSIGSLDEETLFQWVGIDTDEHFNIYLTDSMDHSLKKFSFICGFCGFSSRWSSSRRSSRKSPVK